MSAPQFTPRLFLLGRAEPPLQGLEIQTQGRNVQLIDVDGILKSFRIPADFRETEYRECRPLQFLA